MMILKIFEDANDGYTVPQGKDLIITNMNYQTSMIEHFNVKLVGQTSFTRFYIKGSANSLDNYKGIVMPSGTQIKIDKNPIADTGKFNMSGELVPSE